MPDIDPITREALRRASQMRGSRQPRDPPPQPRKESPAEPHHEEKPPPPKPDNPVRGGVLEALFRDKETALILILIILLMGEKGSEHLLLALIYLLI